MLFMFSKATEYAIRAVIFIAQKGSEEHKLALPEIAEAIQSPPFFTAKILQKLTNGSQLIQSVRGPNGGFYIHPEKLTWTIREILNIMGEGEMLDKCVLGLKLCSEINPCPLHEVYKPIKTQLNAMFENKSIGLLVKEMEAGKFSLI